MGPTAYIEIHPRQTNLLKAHDAKLFTRGPTFTSSPLPNPHPLMSRTWPLRLNHEPHHTQVGTDSKDRFPDLTWDRVEGAKEYILLCEDADLPIPTVVFPWLFLPNSRQHYGCTVSDVDLVQKDGDAKDVNEKIVKAGFKYVKNIQGVHYGGPKPLMGHGPHRYFYQLVVLKEPVDVGKVVGWGEWVEVYERKWQ